MRIALVGYGYWGPNLAKNLMLSPKVEFVGISEVSKQRIERAKEVYGDNIVYTDDYNQFLQDDTVEGIAIATPTSVSFEIIMKALEAGKHVFTEKPISIDARHAEIIKKRADELGLIVHCDHIMLYHPVVRYIKKMIDEGELGELLYVDISRINLGPLRKDVNALLDLAVHDIAVIDYLSDGSEVQNLTALGRACYGQQETLTYLTIQYSSFIAHIKSSWISPIKERRTVVAGTKKMVVFDDMQMDKLTIYDKGFDLQMSEEYGKYEYHARTGDIFMPHIQQEDALRNSVEHFVDCVKEKKESLSGPTSCIRVMKVLDMALNKLKEV